MAAKSQRRATAARTTTTRARLFYELAGDQLSRELERLQGLGLLAAYRGGYQVTAAGARALGARRGRGR